MSKQLHEHLKSLKSIRPEAGFLARNRANLMNAIAPAPERVRLTAFMPILRMSLATATLSLLIFTSLNQAPKETVGAGAVASLDTNTIQAERLAANATGSIADAAYFRGVSPAISLALENIADPSTDWESEIQVKQALAVLTKN